jgi:hypothetical protein
MSEHDWRASVRSVLTGIATLDERVGPVELACMWFDDLYAPGTTQFDASFTAQQLNTLKAFHTVFEAESDGLSEDARSWRTDKGWLRVSSAAKEALGAFPND